MYVLDVYLILISKHDYTLFSMEINRIAFQLELKLIYSEYANMACRKKETSF